MNLRKYKINRKLYAAVAFLLISAVLLVQVAYAWLTLSSAPQVSDASAQVSGNGSLEIALLNGETAANLSLIRSGMGASDLTVANTTWGNLVDLNSPSYGLQQVVLHPAVLNEADGIISDQILGVPILGADGRIVETSTDTQCRIYSADNRFEDFGYGVRAIGTLLADKEQAAESVADTYGYILDLAVRTNVSDANLLLQTAAANRIYSGGAAQTMGGGSFMQFNVVDLNEVNAIYLMQAIRVVFAEPIPDGYRLFATAHLDTENAEISGSSYKVPLRLVDDPDGTAMITPLKKNVPQRLCAIVYMDGRFVKNEFFAYSDRLTLNGVLNLQFATDVDLIPAQNDMLLKGNAIDYASVHTDERVILKGTAGDNAEWSYTSRGRLIISGNGAMDSFNEKKPAPWKDLSVSEVTLLEGITEVGAHAFENHTSITAVSLPKSIVKIGDYAFTGCNALKTLRVPADVTTIGRYAFYGCGELTSVALETALRLIDEGAFMNCRLLTLIRYSGTVAQWEQMEKRGEVKTSAASDDSTNAPSVVDASEGEPLVAWNAGVEHCIIRCSDGDVGAEVKSSNLDEPPVVTEPTEPTEPAETTEPVETTEPTEPPEEPPVPTVWKLYQNGVLVIEGPEKMMDYETPSKAPWYGSREQIRAVVVNDGVSAIGKNAFADCTELTNVMLPETLLAIGDGAFDGCTSLKELQIPNFVRSLGNNAFRNCGALRSVSLGRCLASIGDYAFAGTAIPNILIGNGVETIGEGAFSNCTELSTVSIGYGIDSIGAKAFLNCASLSNLVYNGTKLGWFFVSAGTDWDEGCGAYTLSCIDDLTVVTSGIAGENISWTFFDNSDEENGLLCIDGSGMVELPSWNNYASQIRTLRISGGITGFCADAFADCVELKTTYYQKSVEDWAGLLFENAAANPVSLGGSLYASSGKVTKLNFAELVDKDGNPLPGALGEINDYAFCGFRDVTEVKIPKTVSSIGVDAFAGCISLEKLTLSEGLQRIGAGAFRDCPALTAVMIPASVSSVGEGAFGGCTAPMKLTVAEKNTAYRQNDDGTLLLTEDGKKLLWCSADAKGSIEIPEGVQTVCASAFSGCDKITELVIPKSTVHFEAGVFAGCSALQAVRYAGELTDWMQLQFADEYATPMSAASRITLNGKSFSELVIPDGVARINDFTFFGWNEISAVRLPASVGEIGIGALAACSGLSTIEVDSANPSFKSVRDNRGSLTGLLLSADGSTLVVCGGGDVPPDSLWGAAYHLTGISDFAFYGNHFSGTLDDFSSVVSVGRKAFSGCRNLNYMDLGSVRQIGDRAFENCENLFRLRVSAELRQIGASAFAGCGDFFLDYGGSRSQWGLISCAAGWTGGANADIRTSGGDYGTFGDLIWSLSDDGVLTVSGFGKMPDAPSPWSQWDAVRSVVLGDDITAISSKAFYNCTSLESVTLGKKLSVIGDVAFFACYSLKEVTIPGSVKEIGASAFESCSGLQSLTIEQGVQAIGERAFAGCEKLEAVTIPGSVREIGTSAFEGCYYHLIDSGLQKLTIEQGVQVIGERAFAGCGKLEAVTIPGSVKEIGASAFGSCSDLQSLTIEQGVQAIGERAFAGCEKLEALTIADSVTSIDAFAFVRCNALKSVTLPARVVLGNGAFGSCTSLTEINAHEDSTVYCTQDGILYSADLRTAIAVPGALTELPGLPLELTGIGDYAFYGCSALQSVTIPGSVTSIGSSAFYGCSALRSITLPDGVTSIGSYTFYGCSALQSVTIPNGVTSIGRYTFYGCSALQSITIPGSVTSIGDDAFSGCFALQSITIPDGVTSIGSSTFSGCSALQSITIPDGVTYIGSYAFSSCSALQSVTIPGSVTSIGRYTFYGCSALQSVTIPGSVTSIGYYTFSGCSGLQQIRYGGREEQWKAVFRGTLPEGVTVLYNSN